jgi:hypothetical protein
LWRGEVAKELTTSHCKNRPVMKCYTAPQNCKASPNTTTVTKSRRKSWMRNVARIRDYECIKNLIGKPEGRRPLVRPRWTSENNNGTLGNRMGRHGLDSSGSG